MIKLLVLGAVLYLIYTFLFKKKTKVENEVQDLVECAKCGTFIASDEAIKKNGLYFCSKECVKS